MDVDGGRKRGILDVQASALGTSLITDWCFSRLSVPDFHKHILAEIKDQGRNTHPTIKELCKITPSHGNKDVMKKMSKMRFPTMIEEVKDSLVTHMVLPKTWMGMLCKQEDVWTRGLGADAIALFKFWDGLYTSVEGQKFWMEHPQLQHKTPIDLVHTLPLVVHEDAGPYSKTQSCVEVSFSSVLGKGIELQCKFLVFSYLKENKAVLAKKQPNKAWPAVIKDLVLLEGGLHGPESELAGTPIALDALNQLWKGIVLFGKGDGDQRTDWGMPRATDPDEVCGYCLANRSNRPYTDLRPTAKWQVTEIGSTVVMMARLRQPHHPLADAVFFTFWFFRIDIMHLWDCKGVWSRTIGSVLWLLVHYEHRLGSTQELRLEEINLLMKTFYENGGVKNRLPPLRLTNLTNGQDPFADLSGTMVKAAKTRALLPFAEELADKFFDSGSVYHKAIRKVCIAATTMVDLLYVAGTFLDEEELVDLSQLVSTFGKHYMLCQKLSSGCGDPCWHGTPKVHETGHIPQQAALINPVKVQCYKEESLVGKVTDIWQGCANGSYMRTVQHTVLFKYVLGVLLELQIPLLA